MQIITDKAARLLRLCASPATTSGLLLLLALLIVHGTLYQAVHGILDAQHYIFDSWVVLLAGVVPFPGVKLILALLAANLVAACAGRGKWSLASAGLVLIHAGIALLLLGGLATSMFRSESVMTLDKGASSHEAMTDDGRDLQIPLTLTLSDFRIAYFAGTDAPRDYESRLHAKGHAIDRDIVISMNRPFRYRDYTFYQSSYSPTETGVISILTVVKNPFRSIPPVAGIIIALGLGLHFILKSRRGRHA